MANFLEQLGEGLVSFGSGLTKSQIAAQRAQAQLLQQQAAAGKGEQARNEQTQALLGQIQSGQKPVQPLGGQGPRLPVEQQQAMGQRAIAKLAIQRPEVFEQVNKNLGLISQQQKNEAADFSFDLLNTPPEQRAAKIQQRVNTLSAQGRDPQHTASLLNMPIEAQNEALELTQLAALPVDKRVEPASGGKQGLASAKTEILPDGSVIQALPSGEVQVRDPAGQIVTGGRRLSVLERARQVKTEQKQAEADIAVKAEARKAAAKAGIKLSTQPELSAAVEQAVSTVKAAQTQAGEARSNDLALNAYNAAMKGLADSLSETDTGPFAGLLPALTSNQQIADGAVAAMAPVLKGLFRTSGEGTFTDKDQELLLQMVPTRSDTQKSRQAKIQNIDAIVRAKLGQQPAPENVLRFDAQGNLIQ